MNRFKVANESVIKHYLVVLKSINRSQTFEQLENIKGYLGYIQDRFPEKDLKEAHKMLEIKENNILQEFIVKN